MFSFKNNKFLSDPRCLVPQLSSEEPYSWDKCYQLKSPQISWHLISSLYFLEVLAYKLNKGVFCEKLLFQLLQKMIAGLVHWSSGVFYLKVNEHWVFMKVHVAYSEIDSFYMILLTLVYFNFTLERWFQYYFNYVT